MKTIKILGGVVAVCFLAMGLMTEASAQYYNYGRKPSLSVSQEGGYGSYKVFVSNGDSNSRVVLYAKAQNSNLWSTVVDPIGQTDYNGSLNITTYLGSGMEQFYVTVNSQSSDTVSVGVGSCLYGCGNSGNLWFSPQNPTLNVGQSLAVSISSSGYGYNTSYYISSNSNPSVVTASVSGSILNLYGSQSGSSTINVCHNTSGSCNTIYVVVNAGQGNGNLWFSQSTVNLNQDQNSTINIYSNNQNSGAFYISSNSNYNVVSATVSGNVLSLRGVGNGSANVVVCQYNNNACATLLVSVNASNSGNIWFSPSSLNMNAGQSTTVYIYGSQNYTGSYYISSGSNSYIAAVSITGNQLTVTAYNQGSTSLVVCQSSNVSTCGTLNLTVSGGGWGQNLTFSQNNITLSSGQSANISIYGNGSYYISSNSSAYVASVSLSAGNLYVYGNTQGNTAIIVCQNSPYACGTVMVNVSGSGNTGTLNFSNTTLPVITLGQYYSYQMQAYGGTAPYNFYVVSGQLPVGLSLSQSGFISGIAQNAQSSSFQVRVSDNYGRNATASFTISGNGGVLGSSTYPNGQLISENGTVYIVYRGQKSGFASAHIFTGFGFKFSNVLNVGYNNIPSTGYIINNLNTSHPWGSWVQSGSTIYFVHEQGLVPVPSWEIFLNNRGSSSLVVPANIYDFQKPILAPMSWSDSRLN
ncbi:MAG: hypothetical protein JNN11_01625 [Candidatus Doudnabacteria bacterium]|nr:hypothetical protein [Candidatus Doudnabacteria bacterium]